MSKTNYESPNFDFHEMRLMERVADVCWGGKPHTAYYDYNHDGFISPGDIKIELSGDNCNQTQINLENWLNNATDENGNKLNLPFDSKTDTHTSVSGGKILLPKS